MGIEYDEIVDFLYREAELLDEKQWDAWLDMLDDDILYRMPLRMTRDVHKGSGLVEDMTFYEENKQSLTTRVKRLQTSSAWAEIPPTRTRHIVSNIRVIRSDTSSDRVEVKSYFHVLRSRRDLTDIEQIFGYRHDVLRQADGKWLLLRRTIYPDQVVLNAINLSTFL